MMLKTLTSCLLTVGATSLVGVIAPAQAFTPLSLSQTFNNPSPAGFDYFGNSVSVSGTLALIGAYQDDTGASDAGSAYLFDTTTGNLLKTFNNPSPAGFDYFGYSVSLSGTSALIGANLDDTGASNAGSAYLFDTTTGALLKTFNNPSPADFDQFGNSVSVSGTSALIGAFQDDTGASDAGSAYLFDTTTGALLQTFNNPSPASFDYFGYSVSLSGTSALIGAFQDDTGASNAGSAYLFDTTTGALLKTFNKPTPASGDNFGYSVSVSGTSALIGAFQDDTGASDAGSAYLFNTTTGALLQTFNNPTPADFDGFGNSVSLSGTSALIGANQDSTGATYAGSAYLYQEPQEVQAVPEPSTILGIGVVLGALPVLRKKDVKSNKKKVVQ
ncbi:MAG: PEP-CTERM sorting domain-containing protein [Microcystis sp. M015S2]|uniref:PEP-CTERM sorting domain-containing protein n=1 Tax=Microcystis sp. M015S2 TaxID=2771153 RepID=UPI00258BAB77|nr:PEP-CTERM sorting domain-containing protein [Microcystis sp. M015S2]MCA2743394.1 PEP-CTERM sorting domain-containing protein [Microcystis sp. M015S2]